MTDADLDALARANYEALTTGRYVKPWPPLRDCDREMFRRGAEAVRAIVRASVDAEIAAAVAAARTQDAAKLAALVEPRPNLHPKAGWWERGKSA